MVSCNPLWSSLHSISLNHDNYAFVILLCDHSTGVKIQLERFANRNPNVKDIKEKIGDAFAMGEYIFRRSEYIAVDKDGQVIDTFK